MKRILLLFSALMLSCIALCAQDVEIDGIFYNLDDTNNTAEVTYKGVYSNSYTNEYTGSVSIPETITYESVVYSVTSIDGYAFNGCSGLTSITIPNSVTSIGGYAFEGCSGLSTVTIPNSVTSIGSSAFYDTGIYNNNSNWDNGVLYIDNCLIKVKSNVVKGSYAIKKGTRIIGGGAFSGCSGLTSVTIGNSVTSIGEYAFSSCSGLTKVNYLGTVDEWAEIDFFDNPTYYAKDLYINGELLTDVKIISADSIKRDAFSHCKSIKSVEIGNSVTSIGGYAFYYCSGLSSVSIGNNVTSIGDDAFSYCSGLSTVTIPNSVISIGYRAFSYCSGLTSVTIGNNVTSIGGYAFKNCSGLTSVIWNAKNCANFEDAMSSPFFHVSSQIISFIFGDDVEHIPAYLCYMMGNLKELVIPNGVTSIGDKVFYGAGLNNVESIWDKGVFYVSNYLVRAKRNKMVGNYSIKEGTKVILHDAFEGCELLSSIIIPNSVSSIGSRAFERCIGLTKVNYLGTVEEWAEIDFFANPTYYAKDLYINGELLTDVKIISADSIKSNAFSNCKSIKSVEIGNSVTSIGNSAFSYCSGLTSVSIGNSVTSIGNGAFRSCSALTSVTIGNNVTSIGGEAFSYCSGLSTVTIPNSVISIGYSAFESCSGLTSVAIGNNVTSIGGGAFSYCSGLTSITIPNSVTSIGYGKYTGCAFRGCSSLTSVVWNARNCANFEDEESSPFYNEKGSNITSFTIGDDVETIPSYLCNNLVNLKNLTIGRNLNSIGDYAFEGCRNLERITIFNEEVPMASYNSFVNYDANLYVLCDAYADYYFDIPFGYFKVQCIEADKIENISKIDVDIDENNNVIISWPSEFGAENYELIISKNIESIKQYNFDSKGQLLSIDSNYRSAQVGYSFTVSGLDSGNKYNYKIIALDKNGNILKEYVGEFALKEIVEIIENLADANISIIDGLITIADTDFSIYNISGQDVTSYNGNLSPGVYIIKNEEIITKVMIR